MRRILVWFFGNGEQPSYYMERSYTPTNVRLHAGVSPSGGSCTVDIRDDGISIFAGPKAILAKGDTLNEMAEDFPDNLPPIEMGSIVTCHLGESNGANQITVQLELESSDEDEEVE